MMHPKNDSAHKASLAESTRDRLGSSLTLSTIENSPLKSNPEILLPPIHRLPPELLSYIFQLDDHVSGQSPTPFAWTIAHVCDQWRQVAFDTPNLWSTFVLDISYFRLSAERLSDMLEFLDTCLSLSKMSPLYFVVFLRSRKAKACESILHRLCQHCRRWRRAFFVSSTDVLTPWSHLIRGNTPMLERLGVGNLDGEIGSVDLPSLFGNFAMSSLAFCNYQFDEPLTSVGTSWTRITSLRLIACAYNIIPGMLSQLPNLKELEIEGTPPRASLVYTGHSVELPHLLNLRITGYLHHICNFIGFLRAPLLVELSMTLYTVNFQSHAHVGAAWLVRDFVSRAKKVKKPVVEYVDECYLDSIQDHAIRFIR